MCSESVIPRLDVNWIDKIHVFVAPMYFVA